MVSPWRTTLAVAAIGAVTFFSGLGLTHLWDEDEPKNAVCGQEMFERGDWIVPTFNGQLRTDKPILIYWCMIAVYNVLGVSEMAARLPSALAGVGAVVLTFHLGRLMFNSRAGLLASCLAASALMFAVLARGATPDSLLIFCITASVTSFVAGVAARRGGNFNGQIDGRGQGPDPIQKHGLPLLACIGMYASMGFAVLAKGPIGVVMPLGIIGSYLLFFDNVEPATAGEGWMRRARRYFAPQRIFQIARTLRIGWGLPLAALIALPWYVAVYVQTNGEWVAGFLGNHNIGRFMHPMEHHRGLPIYYIVAILIGFFPGSVFLPVGLWSMVSSVRRQAAEKPAAAFLLCWICCYVGFFTLAATKLPNYVVPCYPALAVVTGYWLSLALGRQTVRNWQLWAGYSTFVVVGIGATIALAIVSHVVLQIDPTSAVAGLVAVVGGLACLSLLYRGRVGGSVVAFMVTCIAFTTTAMTYTAWCASQSQDAAILAAQLRTYAVTQSSEGPRVATYNYSTPSLVYYVGHHVQRLTEPQQIATFFAEGGDAIVMPRTAYEKHGSLLPDGLVVLGEASRFMKKDEKIVALGRPVEIAKANSRKSTR